MFFLRAKVQDVKQAEFFLLDVFYAYKSAVFFIRLCAFCTFYAKQTTFFLLDVFMRIKMSFLFAFVPFVRARLKTPLIPLFTILLLPFLTQKWEKFFSQICIKRGISSYIDLKFLLKYFYNHYV